MAAAVACTAAALLTLLPGSARARSDGPEWEAAANPDGCRSCHLASDAATSAVPADVAGADDPAGAGDPAASVALAIDGLPASPQPGGRYPLTIRLTDPALRNAGFLLSLRTADSASDATGTLEAIDERVETDGRQARSTWDGQWPAEPGRARWELVWQAPETDPAGVRFDLWANAGNDDLSPLGDTVRHVVLKPPASP